MTARGAAILTALALTACATAPPRSPQSAACRDYFEALDAQVARAGVRDAGAHRIDGFPYLRVDRFISSFVGELSDETRQQIWLELARNRDVQARRAELANLGLPEHAAAMARVEECGRVLTQFELSDPPTRHRMWKGTKVPDEYSEASRVLGFYPLALPFLNLGIGDYHRQTKNDFAKPLAELDTPGPLVAWEATGNRPAPKDAKAWLADTDALGIPYLDAEQWMTLARAHAPTWWIEEAGRFDQPGAPQRLPSPDVDTSRAVTYFQPAFTRFAGKVLPQLVYTIWFSERPRSSGFDSYAGALDGLVWRVTLDADGRPMLYDTIHPCGCYHYFFPVWRAAREVDSPFWQEPRLFPQQAVPRETPVAVRIQSGTHYVRRVVPQAQAKAAQKRTYELAWYGELLSLEMPDGKRHSLFDEDGVVAGSDRLERWWFWITGVADAGAMRQWGRQPTSFVGESHFDDPFLLEQLFELTD
jgi:hypothetical protein